MIAALVLPPVPLLLLVLIGARLLLPRRGLGWLVIVVSVVAALAVGVHRRRPRRSASCCCQPPPALSFDRVRELRAEAAAKKPVAIVILGAGSEPFAPEYGVSSLQYPSLERLRYGLWLAGQTGAPVAFSGGAGWAQRRHDVGGEASPPRSPPRSSAGRSAGSKANRSDTRENATLTMALLKPAGINHVVLVTHGYHMPRAMRAFTEAAGAGVQVEAAPMGLARERRARRRSNGCRARRLPRHAPAAARARRQRRRRLSAAATPWAGAARSPSTIARATAARSSTTATTGRCASCARSIRKAASATACSSIRPAASSAATSWRSRSTLGDGAHALVTTPGATRFYRSAGAPATQSLARRRRRAAAGSSGCRSRRSPTAAATATNALRFELAPGAEMIGWDVTALGLPASDQPFDAGRFTPERSSCPGAGSSAAAIAAGDASPARLAARLGRPARPRDDVVRRRRRARAGAPRRACSTRRARVAAAHAARRDDRRDRRRRTA